MEAEHSALSLLQCRDTFLSTATSILMTTISPMTIFYQEKSGVGAVAHRRAAQLVIEYNEDLQSANKAQQLGAFVAFCQSQMVRDRVANCDVLVVSFFDVVPVLKDAGPIVERLLDDTGDISGDEVRMHVVQLCKKRVCLFAAVL